MNYIQGQPIQSAETKLDQVTRRKNELRAEKENVVKNSLKSYSWVTYTHTSETDCQQQKKIDGTYTPIADNDYSSVISRRYFQQGNFLFPTSFFHQELILNTNSYDTWTKKYRLTGITFASTDWYYKHQGLIKA